MATYLHLASWPDIRSYQSVFVIISPFSPSSWKAFCTVGLHNRWMTAVIDADASQVARIWTHFCTLPAIKITHPNSHAQECNFRGMIRFGNLIHVQIRGDAKEGINNKKSRVCKLAYCSLGVFLSSVTFWAVQQIFIQFTENEPAVVAIVEFLPCVQLTRISPAG